MTQGWGPEAVPTPNFLRKVSQCLRAQDHPQVPQAAFTGTCPACMPALHGSALLIYHQVGSRAWPLGKGFSAAGPLCQGMGVAGICGLPRHLEDKSILRAIQGVEGVHDQMPENHPSKPPSLPGVLPLWPSGSAHSLCPP